MLRGGVSVGIERDGVLTPVSHHASGLRFSKTAMGGHASLSVSLALPTGWEVSALDRVVVSDHATGGVLWDGYAEWPTPIDGDGVRFYSLSALGGQSLLSDVLRPQFYCDYLAMMDTEAWVRQPLNMPGGSGEVANLPTATSEVPAVVVAFPERSSLPSGRRTAMQYDRPAKAGRTLFRLGIKRECGITSSNFAARVETADGTSWTTNSHLSATFSTSPATLSAWAGSVGTLAGGVNAVRLQVQQVNGSAVSVPDDAWAAWYGLHATAALFRQDGSWRAFADYPEPGAYPGLRADMVVEDMLARHLTGVIDAAGAEVETSVQNIDQLTAMGGVRDAEFLDSLTTWEPDFMWQVGARGPDGKHSFSWRKWPTSPRYILPSTVEFAEDGPSITLCNRITVRWRTPQGADRLTVVTTPVPALDDAGRTRDADPVDLPDGYGSQANAERIGAMVLAATNDASTSGTVTVRRPIRDDVLGRDVWPWEIEPGHLVWLPRGEAVRIQEVEYDDDAGTAVLRLGSISPAMEQMTAGLAREDAPAKRAWGGRMPKKRKGRRRRRKGRR